MVSKKIITDAQKALRKAKTALKKNHKAFEKNSTESYRIRREGQSLVTELHKNVSAILMMDDKTLQEYIWTIVTEKGWYEEAYHTYVMLRAPIKKKNDPIQKLLGSLSGLSYISGRPRNIASTLKVGVGSYLTINAIPASYWCISFLDEHQKLDYAPAPGHAVHNFIKHHKLKTRLSNNLRKERECALLTVESIDTILSYRNEAIKKKKVKNAKRKRTGGH